MWLLVAAQQHRKILQQLKLSVEVGLPTSGSAPPIHGQLFKSLGFDRPHVDDGMLSPVLPLQSE